MPEVGGLELVRRLSERAPNTKVIVLSVDGDDHVVREAIQLGVRGYVLKNNTSAEILRAVGRCLQRALVLQPGGHEHDCRHLPEGTSGRPNALSRRETEVLRLLADGIGSKQIADALGVSATTIDSHRHNIMKRLGLFSIAELTIARSASASRSSTTSRA